MKTLFGTDYQLTENNSVVFSDASRGKQFFHILGVKESTNLGAEQAFIMAGKVIELLEKKSLAVQHPSNTPMLIKATTEFFNYLQTHLRCSMQIPVLML
jgi:hypothetical protein